MVQQNEGKETTTIVIMDVLEIIIIGIIGGIIGRPIGMAFYNKILKKKNKQ